MSLDDNITIEYEKYLSGYFRSFWHAETKQYLIEYVQKPTKFYWRHELAIMKEQIDALNKDEYHILKEDGIYDDGKLVYRPKYKGDFPARFLKDYKYIEQ